MAKLLKDNMEVERRWAAQAGEGSQQSQAINRGSRREVPDMLSWLHCFSLYTAIMCEAHPEKNKETWAYQAMMISEAHRRGGRGWLLYDSAFRQQVVSLESANFGRLNQALYATTFLAYGGRGQFCPLCMLPDHGQDDCALHPSRSFPTIRLSDMAERQFRPEQRRGKSAGRRPCFAWNDGRCSLATIMCAPSAMAATGERCAKDGWRMGHMRKGERTQKPGDKDWTEGNGHTGGMWLRCCHTLADY